MPAPTRSAAPVGAPFLLDRPDPDRAPLTVAWEITRACPLACVHCRAEALPRRQPGELTLDEGKALIDDVAAMGTKVFVVTGGDPLARGDVFDLLSHVRGTGLHAGFSPSTTPRLTATALERAVAAGVGTIHLSLDGATPEAHDGFRGVRGSFTRALRAIDTTAALPVRLQVGTTVSRRTVGDLPAIAGLLAGRVSLWSLFFLVATGRGSHDDVLAAPEVERVLRWLATTDLGFPARTIEAPTYRRVRYELGLPTPTGVTDGNGFAFVSHIGDVQPSGFLPLTVGNVRARPLSYWYREHPLFRALRDPSHLHGRCGRCEHRERCGGSRAAAYAATGDPFGEDPGCVHVPAVDREGAVARDAARSAEPAGLG